MTLLSVLLRHSYCLPAASHVTVQIYCNKHAYPITGVPKVGLTEEDLELLANFNDVNRGGREVLKASRRDIGYAIATKSNAATTVSGTMILAHAAGRLMK